MEMLTGDNQHHHISGNIGGGDMAGIFAVVAIGVG